MVRNTTLATTRIMPDETVSEDDATKTRQRIETQAWPAAAMPARRRPKVLLSVRIDHDVLEWFRAHGPGYQTRMNAVLRAYMEHARGTHAESSR